MCLGNEESVYLSSVVSMITFVSISVKLWYIRIRLSIVFLGREDGVILFDPNQLITKLSLSESGCESSGYLKKVRRTCSKLTVGG